MTENIRNATSSWNGYSHQGKVGIFVALKQINELMSIGHNLSTWSLVFEQNEDFDICNSNISISRHQVKCKYSSSTMNSMGVFGINEFDLLDNSENYLHSVTDLTDYEFESDIKNPNRIKLYEYESGKKYCRKEINSYINNEINNILSLKNHEEYDNQSFLEQVNSEICFKLSSVLQEEHLSGQNKPELNFSDIVDIITSYKFSELAINTYRRIFFQVYEEYLEECDKESVLINTELSKVVTDIVNCDDESFKQYISNIFIDKENVFQQKNYSNFVTMFNEDGLCDVFFKFFNTINYQHDVSNYAFVYKSEYVLTAVNSESASKTAENIWRNIRINKNINPFEKSKIINKEINCILGEKINDQYNCDKKRSDNILNPKEVSLITKINAKLDLES